ncbi:MAG: hypothetical protein HY658_03805 [Actinobacteria bacterium]|nr:hypothetical protein [Actinomycetota bacterium]
MAQQRPGFDISKLSTASKILLGGGIIYLINLFLPWQRVDLGPIGSVSRSGLAGIGVLNLLLVLAIGVMEVLTLANVQVNIGTPVQRGIIDFGLTVALFAFTLIKILVDNEAIFFLAWLGLILAAVVVYGGYMRWNESKVTTPPPSAPPPPPPPAP